MAGHPDVEEEQEFLDRAYQGLEAMRADANRMLESVLDLGRGGTFQSRTERDIVVRTSLARLAQLELGDQALCFGRIDRLIGADPAAGLEAFHIGRLAVSGEDLEPLVVDWRAPVAEPFYRATGLDPQGLARRRHLAVRGRTVTGVEDEYFAQAGLAAGTNGHGPAAGGQGTGGDGPGADGAADHGGGRLLEAGLSMGGPGALLASLGQARTGHMGDIVATIQREQDEIIRSPLPGVLVVQGGPGTGKTAVALHRAAYLLYTHRFPLERQGVLVIGPNPLFLRYIEQVLPSLGETGVTLSTVSGLVAEVRVRGTEEAAVARLKGEARLAKVMARAVRTRQRPLRDNDLSVPFGSMVLRFTAAESAEIVGAARRRPGHHNARRRFVETQVLARLSEQYLARLSAAGAAALDDLDDDDGTEASPVDAADVRRQLRRLPVVAEALDRMWPRLAPHELLHDLYGARPLLVAAGTGLLSSAEIALLARPRSPSLDEVVWTPADAALVDEARALLGPRRARPTARARPDHRQRLERTRQDVGFWPAGLDLAPVASNGHDPGAEAEEVRSYGHIVVDEVQDLSPMQLRMLARRSISGSMTIVGDIAQATGPWAPTSWEDVTRHLTPRRAPRRVELTVSYRTPMEVLRLAQQVLAVAAPDIAPPRPVRRSGVEPVVVAAEPGALAARAAGVAAALAQALSPGRVAVLVPARLMGPVTRALAERGVSAVDPRDPQGEGLSAPLVILPADEANGLEFDGVVVVEPAMIAAGPSSEGSGTSTRGLRTLYVAFTRPTRQLSVVHEAPLPAGISVASAVAPAG